MDPLPRCCRRRDLESARTLADQVRKREKLKRRELQLYKEEWAARMQGEACWAAELCRLHAWQAHHGQSLTSRALHPCAAIRDGVERVVLRQGRVKDPPVQLSAVWRMEAFGPAASAGSEYSDELSDEHLAMGAPQDAAAQAEDRAARLAMRRYARDAALGLPPPRSQQKQQQPARPRSGVATQRKAQQLQPGPARAAAASPILNQGGNVRGPPAGRGESFAGMLCRRGKQQQFWLCCEV